MRHSWQADTDLVALLRRYYSGEAGLWAEIQARVHALVVAQGLPASPRHISFRATTTGYQVIVEDAAPFAAPE